MRDLFLPVLLLAALLPTGLVAQTGPSFDCAKSTSSAEILICQDAELGRLDRDLSDRYRQALDAAGSLDVGADAEIGTLKATQRGWIKGRDECWKADDLSSCVLDSYQTRDAYLVARWFLQEPSKVVFWACGGSPANEVVTYFFDTARPSLRFERGDSIDFGILTRTASGARYDGENGRWIWIKGDQATYRDPDPAGETFACTIASQN